ncbi:MAG: RdgB/HAM1 family non-canonical purine NTP pyrophosphatase [Bryobacterales bacterium]|nr:RdgB/HAM1 family non-canonical purine NTP pyrophosphatase [Bryobacterales bacterium]
MKNSRNTVRLIAATSNKGKLREFALAAEGYAGFEILPLPEFQKLPGVEEIGRTFEENARIKAVHYSAFTDEFLYAEDSGLVVDALNGAPGVYSARFAGVGATDAANNHLLLERLRGVEDRSARFVCVIALARRGSVIATFEGSVEGTILREAKGLNGFGYDPLFYYPPAHCTTAELDPARKLEISHRGKAIRKLFDWAGSQDFGRGLPD